MTDKAEITENPATSEKASVPVSGKREVAIKRAYDQPDPADGYRILVDRLWPRGISKARARIDLWLKDIAPSNDLRKSWGHNPQTFDDFIAAYRKEIEERPQGLTVLEETLAAHQRVTLVYAAKSPVYNQAAVLRDYLLDHPELFPGLELVLV